MKYCRRVTADGKERKKERKKKKKKKKKKKNKMNIFVAGFLDGTKRQANFEGCFALYRRCSFV